MSRLDDIRNASQQAPEEPQAVSNVLEGPKPRGIVKEPYKAFSAPTGDAQIRLIIYAKRFYMMPQYAVLYDVFFEGMGEFVSLIFPHHRVSMWGRNLLPIVTALRTNSVEWLTEYDAMIHLADADPDAPVIESIEILTTVENPLGDPNTPPGSPVN
jgi:hypothetical protein